jgi:hypothetical protein
MLGPRVADATRSTTISQQEWSLDVSPRLEMSYSGRVDGLAGGYCSKLSPRREMQSFDLADSGVC